MWHSINQTLSAKYFISYSRAQTLLACRIKEAVGSRAQAVWMDSEGIGLGDDWRERIHKAISATDELILLLSDEAALSAVVAEEVAAAVRLGKPVRPFVITRMSQAIPPDIARLNYRDVSQQSEAARVATIADCLHTHDQGGDWRLLSARRIYPRFETEWIRSRARIGTRPELVRLLDICGGCAADSTILLNLGLLQCVCGTWREGIETLRKYAHQANSFAGWYFLALSLAGHHPLSKAAVEVVNEAHTAIQRAVAFQAHPLVILTLAVIEQAGMNLGDARLHARVAQFADTARLGTEDQGEVIRALWCLDGSLRALEPFETNIRHILREMCHGNH